MYQAIKVECAVDTCPRCGCVFAVPLSLIRAQQRTAGRKNETKIRCPNGHLIRFPTVPTAEQAAGNDLEEIKQRVEAAQAELMQLRHEREQLEADISRLKSGELPAEAAKRPRGRPRKNPTTTTDESAM